MGKALIVVDVQVDFCEGGALAVVGGNQVAEAIAHLIEGKHSYDVVVATRDHHIDPGDHFSDTPDYVNSWPPHCVVGTPGQSLHPALRHIQFDAIFDKGSYAAAYSGFEGKITGDPDETSLADWLSQRGVTAVEICGIATDYCVSATAADAATAGLRTTVLADLTAAVRPAGLADTRAQLKALGVRWISR